MGKLYQNKWAGYETYFTPCFPVRTRKNESDAIGGYEITNVDGKWKCRKGQYYLYTMRDEEHFPVVGEVKINVLGYVMDTMLNALERRTDEPEQKTGKWILKEHLYECDKCGCRISRFPFKGNIWNYYFCPNCGAKMEEGEQDGKDT